MFDFWRHLFVFAFDNLINTQEHRSHRKMNKHKTNQAKRTTKTSISTRISEPPLKKVSVINHNRRSLNDNEKKNDEKKPVQNERKRHSTNDRNNDRFAQPELNSALTLAKQIELLHIQKNKKLSDFDQMTPRTKAVATSEVCLSTKIKRKQ